MCRKFVLASNLDKIENRFQVRINQNTLPIPESFSVAAGVSSYVITSENPYEIQVMKFGMTPYCNTYSRLQNHLSPNNLPIPGRKIKIAHFAHISEMPRLRLKLKEYQKEISFAQTQRKNSPSLEKHPMFE